MTRDETDPVLALLAALRAPHAAKPYEDRVRNRCHEAMRRRSRPRSPKPFLQRIADAALIGVAGGYAAIAFIEAAQVAARFLGGAALP